MIKVEVNDETITTSTRGAYTFYEQTAWATFLNQEGKPNPHPEKVILQLQKNQAPHKLGSYQIHPSSFYRNRYDQLALGRIVLVPIKQQLSAAA
jgi:hypothetical protein